MNETTVKHKLVYYLLIELSIDKQIDQLSNLLF